LINIATPYNCCTKSSHSTEMGRVCTYKLVPDDLTPIADVADVPDALFWSGIVTRGYGANSAGHLRVDSWSYSKPLC
jgi:hypothetical protein